jgi:hypothetical protein
MKDQFLSVKQMSHLRDLGVDTSKANLYWARRCHGSKINDNSTGKWFLSLDKEFMTVGFTSYEVIPAFTLQDLLNIIPSRVFSKSNEVFSLRIERYIDGWEVYYGTTEDSDGSKLFTPIYRDTLLEAAYNMLCYLAENKLLEKEGK